jgi:hypothetical protein
MAWSCAIGDKFLHFFFFFFPFFAFSFLVRDWGRAKSWLSSLAGVDSCKDALLGRKGKKLEIR